MAVTESQRQRLFRKVEEIFGPEEAAVPRQVTLAMLPASQGRHWQGRRRRQGGAPVEEEDDARGVPGRRERGGRRLTGHEMEVVLPGSWNDVATKRDLDELRRWVDQRFARAEDRFSRVDDRFDEFELRLTTQMNHRFELVEHRLSTIEANMVDKAMLHRELRLHFATILTANVAVAGLALAIAQSV
jgi:hypothetical protein